MVKFSFYIIVAILIGTLTACFSDEVIPDDENIIATAWAAVTIPPTETAIPTPTPEPPSVLTVCLGDEPSSLFLYGDISASARGILQSIYDGPYDVYNGRVDPVILLQIPTLENGGAELRQVSVQPGTVIMDAFGNWVSLQEGVSYRPSGCLSEDCAQIFEGDQPVFMDELLVRFQLLPEIQWSDGTPLTASDSVYSYEIAKQIFGNTLEILRFTKTYLALDSQTVEWKSIPGFQGPYAINFFSPLPNHFWNSMSVDELFTSEKSVRSPIGWGPYIIEEWTPNDHITLSRNNNYFRIEEGLPLFDYLVFRFTRNGQDAIDALLVGECDFVDETALEIGAIPQLAEIQTGNQIRIQAGLKTSWEQMVFGIDTLIEDHINFFDEKEVRQAIALCTNRQLVIDQLLMGFSEVPETFLLPGDVYQNPDVASYPFNPEAALELLASAGWVDFDQDVNTPLTSFGIAGVEDGTELAFDYIVPKDAHRQKTAELIKESLAQCGVRVNLIVQNWEQFLEPGPDGVLFGRRFDMTQLAWAESKTSPCILFMSDEIPGSTPEYEKGWGGLNLSGYSSPDYDKACRSALYTLPDLDENRQAHNLAQAIYSGDLPSVPLYWLPEITAMRSDMCLAFDDLDTNYKLAFIEAFGFGGDCD